MYYPTPSRPVSVALIESAAQADARKRIEEIRRQDAIRTHWWVSLDLGQAQDYSALMIGTTKGPSEKHLTKINIEIIRRWPLGTPYPLIVENVTSIFDKDELFENGADASLVVDWTGVGRPVVDLFRRARLANKKLLVDVARLIAVTITKGKGTRNDDWMWWIDKMSLVAAAQLALQNGCLQLPPIETVPEVEDLMKELQNFRYKQTADNNLTAAAREGVNDDLVLSLSQLCFMAQRPHRSKTRFMQTNF